MFMPLIPNQLTHLKKNPWVYLGTKPFQFHTKPQPKQQYFLCNYSVSLSLFKKILLISARFLKPTWIARHGNWASNFLIESSEQNPNHSASQGKNTKEREATFSDCKPLFLIESRGGIIDIVGMVMLGEKLLNIYEWPRPAFSASLGNKVWLGPFSFAPFPLLTTSFTLWFLPFLY